MPVGSVLIFTDPLMTNGDLSLYIHGVEGDIGDRHALLEASSEFNCGGFVNVGDDGSPVLG